MTTPIAIRDGSPADADLLIACFDEAVRWLVARGQPGQWGTEPFSTQPRRIEGVRRLAARDGLRIAELHGQPVGVLAIGDAPAYASRVDDAELYITLLLTSRRHAGRRIGDALVRRAIDEARAAGRELLRVDCWAGAPRLVRWYEDQGFVPTETFDVDGWIGQLFRMTVGRDGHASSAITTGRP